MRDFKTLIVWQSSHELALLVYRSTRHFPAAEKYGLTEQMRRAATSVPSNIAEGCGRATDADFRRFLVIAMGSASELEYQLLLARDLRYVARAEYEFLLARTVEVKRMLTGLMRKLAKDRQR